MKSKMVQIYVEKGKWDGLVDEHTGDLVIWMQVPEDCEVRVGNGADVEEAHISNIDLQFPAGDFIVGEFRDREEEE